MPPPISSSDPKYSSTQHRDPFQPGLLNELAEPPQKIVVLRATRIGDFINAGPAFRALRRHFPKARIDLITLPMLFDLASRLELFDHVIEFTGYPGLAEQFFNPARVLNFFGRMQATQYDLAIQMQGSGVYANPFMLMIGAAKTAGFVRDGDPAGLLDAALPVPQQHETLRNMNLIEFLGIPAEVPRPEFPLGPADHVAAQALLNNFPRPWIGIHTSARDITRRWPPQRFVTAARKIQSQYGGTIVLIGEESDREAIQVEPDRLGPPFLDLSGRTTLPVSGAVINRLDIFLTNDTGPAHIAYALKTPTVTIFGGGDPARNGPIISGPFRVLAFPVSCRPCETGQCPIDLYCLENISVNAVVRAAEEIIRR